MINQSSLQFRASHCGSLPLKSVSTPFIIHKPSLGSAPVCSHRSKSAFHDRPHISDHTAFTPLAPSSVSQASPTGVAHLWKFLFSSLRRVKDNRQLSRIMSPAWWNNMKCSTKKQKTVNVKKTVSARARAWSRPPRIRRSKPSRL